MAVRVFIVFLSLVALAFSQSFVRNSVETTSQGRIWYPAGAVLSDFSVELCEPRGARRTIGKTTITDAGQLLFDRVPTSLYLVRVTSRSGSVIGEQIVSPSDGQSRVQ